MWVSQRAEDGLLDLDAVGTVVVDFGRLRLGIDQRGEGLEGQDAGKYKGQYSSHVETIRQIM